MNIDGFTLFVIFMLISWTGVFCVGFLWASNREIRGLGYWFYSQVLYALTTLFIITDVGLSDPIKLFITNTTFFFALILFFHGHLTYLRIAHPTPLYGAVFVGHFTLITYFCFIDNSVSARIIVMSLISAILTTYIAGQYWTLWRQRYQANHLFATLALTLSALVNVARVLPHSTHSSFDLFDTFADSPVLYVCLFWTQLIQIFVFFALINTVHINNLRHLANYDPLTNTYNRRSFMETADKLFSRFKMNEQPLVLMMVDVDWFKSINDTHGHPAGDEALRSLVSTIKQELRPRDMLGRYGGEEFCILLEGTDIEHAKAIAERIRKAVEAKRVNIGSVDIHMSVSIGISHLDTRMKQFSDMLSHSDKALYEAKQTGRNRVVLSA